MELKSLSQRIECVKLESWSLRMLSDCLGDSSMCLGVPFIAPRQLGAVGGQQGRPNLSFCRVVHRTVTVAVRCVISFLFGASDHWSSGSIGAPDSPVCPTDRCCEPRVARRLSGRPLAHRTVWCTTGQSGEL
jgi:hypothetical protein